MKYLATGLKLKMDPGMHGGFQLKFLDVVFLDPVFLFGVWVGSVHVYFMDPN